MFSMMPKTGTSTLRNMFRPLRASSRAMSWGVDTITAPVTGTSWAMAELDVAGARRQVDDQDVELAPLESAAASAGGRRSTIGPRQIIGVSSATRKPMDMHFTP